MRAQQVDGKGVYAYMTYGGDTFETCGRAAFPGHLGRWND